MNWIENEAIKIEKKIIAHHRYLHKNAECGFSLEKTYSYVFNVLKELGCQPRKCGTMGIATKISGNGAKYAFTPYSLSINLDEKNEQEITKPQEKDRRFSILLRADMDALPMKEKTSLPYKSETECMHSCGHDMHTAMLLGAAEILINNKDKFASEITLLFQPSEETLEGANDILNSGDLDTSTIDYGIMIHALTDTKLDTGALILPQSETIAPCADLFEIEILGKGAHGAMPEKTIDPILIGAHISLALEELITREFAGVNGTALTIGEFSGGNAPNVIPEASKINGTIRTYDEARRSYMKKRVGELAKAQAEAFNGTANVSFGGGCPTFKNDINLSKSAHTCLKNTFSSTRICKNIPVIFAPKSDTRSSLASEDFSYFSHKIPCTMIALAAGKSEDGFSHPLHSPRATFDEKALLYGTIAYCAIGANLK